jgi:hypothetical protein
VPWPQSALRPVSLLCVFCSFACTLIIALHPSPLACLRHHPPPSTRTPP